MNKSTNKHQNLTKKNHETANTNPKSTLKVPKSTKTNHQKVESRTKKDKKYQDISKGVKMFLKSLVSHDKRSNIQYNDVIKKYTDNVIYQICIEYNICTSYMILDSGNSENKMIKMLNGGGTYLDLQFWTT